MSIHSIVRTPISFIKSMRTWHPLAITIQCDPAFVSHQMSIMVAFIWTFSANNTQENTTQTKCIHIHSGIVPLSEEPVTHCWMQHHQEVHPQLLTAPAHS